jgi:nucleotide-binding universal stress UspA family protein
MKRVLVAYDGTTPARKALSEAIGFAKQGNATISIVSVVPIHGGRVPIDPSDNRASHTAQLKEAREILAEAGISANVLERVGDPARMIEKLVDDLGFDTVVLGSRGLGGMRRFLQGSVSEHVATHANATVVIAR